MSTENWLIHSFIYYSMDVGCRHIFYPILDVAPYIGQMSIPEAEKMVFEGFKTLVPNVSNPDYLEEGIVARPVVPIKDPRGKRIIVKIKTCDYNELQAAIKQVGEEEYFKFNG